MKRRPVSHRSFGRAAAVALVAIAAAAPAATPGSQQTDLKGLPDSAKPIRFSSAEGRFQTTFPTGCARMQRKQNTPIGEDAASPTVKVRVVFATCERHGRKDEGCQVSASLGALRDEQGQAAVDEVLAVVRKLMSDYGVTPFRQVPISRDFGSHGKVEGVDVHAREPMGVGEVWIRGLMRGPDMYVLLAWKSIGGLFTDPEYSVFFNEFRPWPE